MPAFSREEADQLMTFGNALRDVLDLEPLYRDGRGASHKEDVIRFNVEPFPDVGDTGLTLYGQRWAGRVK